MTSSLVSSASLHKSTWMAFMASNKTDKISWYHAGEQLHSLRRRQWCCWNQRYVSIALLNSLSNSLSFSYQSNRLHTEQSLPLIPLADGLFTCLRGGCVRWRYSVCLAEAVTALGRAFLHKTNALRHQDCQTEQLHFCLSPSPPSLISRPPTSSA